MSILYTWEFGKLERTSDACGGGVYTFHVAMSS
jgi:hypothetical protein